jgi:phytoene synthase
MTASTGEPASIDHARRAARAVLASKSKSFALATKLLPSDVASKVVVLYAYCRRADDAVDLASPAEQPAKLAELRAELDRVYGKASRGVGDPSLEAFAQVVRECGIPRRYVEDLLAGMQMDVEGASYATLSDLALYAYRVAGVVGLMMCHVMGVRDPRALEHAAHLGIGMQLTNIARDVQEDWQRGRLYLPDALLAKYGAGELRSQLLAAEPAMVLGPHSFPAEHAGAAANATSELLDCASAYYASGDAGMAELSLRCGLAVRTARLVYAAIGDRVRRQACNPLAGRAVVPASEKLWLVGKAIWQTARSAPESLHKPAPRVPGAVWAPTRLVL